MINSNPYLRTAVQELQSGQVAKAKNLIAGVLNQNPSNPDAWFLLGTALEEPRETAYCFRQALSIRPDHAETLQGIEQIKKNLDLEPLQVMEVGTDSVSLNQTCPYCQARFKITEQVVVCPNCKRAHHYVCWMENGNACAGRLCTGFSLEEVILNPLPVQQPKTEKKEIILTKENIPQVEVASRKAKEEIFTKKMLLMALLAEEGALAPDQTSNLPPVDDLLDQLQRDRTSQNQQSANIKKTEIPTSALNVRSDVTKQATLQSKFCIHCGKAYPRFESKYCIYCGKPREQS